MRDYKQEFESRVEFIRGLVKSSGASGIVYGNSGGKDCSLVSILCKAACSDTVGLIMPCSSSRNFGSDRNDALEIAVHYGIETRQIDLTEVKSCLLARLDSVTAPSSAAISNIAPRLRMTALYAVAAAENRLVAGTGNRSEFYVGYFTKWGDGGCDFNPISDLTVTEVYEFLEYLNAPMCIRTKAPSAGLFEGQTDEAEMGVTYAAIDSVILGGDVGAEERAVIDHRHRNSAHKRSGIAHYHPTGD